LDKILKISKKLWLIKERLVLVVLLGFLAFNIYKIFVPKVPEVAARTTPGSPPAASVPFPVKTDGPGQYRALHTRNPFSYYSDAVLGGKSGVTAEEAGIHLLDLKQVGGGKWRARLKTKSTKWWDEGDSFEEFVLEKIDPESRTVIVYVTKLAKPVTLSVEE
jgi:hypothetical protein